MKMLSPKLPTRLLTGSSCIVASLWIVARSYHWIHATWFSDNGDLTVPIMAALFAGMLIWTGLSTIFRLKDDRDGEIIEALEERELYGIEPAQNTPASLRPQLFVRQSRRAAPAFVTTDPFQRVSRRSDTHLYPGRLSR